MKYTFAEHPNLLSIWTYCEAIARYAEVLEPSQPVHDAGKVHQQTWENLKTQKDEAFYDIWYSDITTEKTKMGWSQSNMAALTFLMKWTTKLLVYYHSDVFT